MKIGTEKKLVLNRETIRSLSVQEMQGVAGGFSALMTSVLAPPVSKKCGDTTLLTTAGDTTRVTRRCV